MSAQADLSLGLHNYVIFVKIPMLPVIYYCIFVTYVLIDFWLTVKTATLIYISWRGSAILSAEQGKSGSIHNLVKN